MAHKVMSREDPLIQIFSPCDVGTRLLEEFADARSADYTFLEPKDFSDLRTSAFAAFQSGTDSRTTLSAARVVVRFRYVRTLREAKRQTTDR